jgi:hypothetical protein
MPQSDGIKKEMEELARALNYHNVRYYVEDSPEISDYEYDRMMRRLRALEEENPALVRPDSPTRRWEGRPSPSYDGCGPRGADGNACWTDFQRQEPHGHYGQRVEAAVGPCLLRGRI